MVLGQRGGQVLKCVPGVSAHPFLTQGGQHGQVVESSQGDMKLSLCVATHVGFPLDGSNPDFITPEQLPEPAGSTEAILGGWYRGSRLAEWGHAYMSTWSPPYFWSTLAF